ncbi:hypothetical protein DTO271G3_1223 [Paecilomyces variotii]|nr:hypothetical protein DTO271G3_1223 [Paecilomyces variotii]
MSGYLPPRTTTGPHSDIYTPSYQLQRADTTDDHTDVSHHWPVIPSNIVPSTKTLLTLGDPDNPIVSFAPLGFGCWPWGDVLSYGWGPSNGYDKRLDDASVTRAWKEIFRNVSPVLLDTAEHYGYTDGYSEKSIGRNWSEDTTKNRPLLQVATKFMPTPWRHPFMYPDIVYRACAGSLDRLGLGKIDIYQLHGPSYMGFWPRLETIVNAMADCYDQGKIKAVGTCNLNIEQVKAVYTILKKRGVPYVSNQVEFSLARQDPWKTGLIENCRKLGIATIAYSPIGVGRLTGKYNGNNKPRGNRNFADVKWDKLQPIIDELLRIGEKTGKSPAAVALNWVICKGAVPIPGVKNENQVIDCAQALGWRLSKEDEDRLDVLGLFNAPDYRQLQHVQNWWWEQG